MKTLLAGILIGLAVVPAPSLRAAQDIVIADFEGPDYGQWTTTGEAFGPGPARGTLPGQMPVDGYQGKGLVNSFYQGDSSMGTLTSPPLKLERRYVSFLIGGGKDAEKCCLNLLIDGKIVRNATGRNDKPGGTETLAPDYWDVSEFADQTAVLQIVDRATGGWGHIDVDQIVQTDQKPPGLLTNPSRQIRLEKRYLNLPVKNGGTKRQMRFLVEGQPPRNFEIELADAQPDWWAFIEIAPLQGKQATLSVDTLREDSAGLKAIDQTDEIKNSSGLYHERLRGQFHFSARRGWNNDPNGLVFYRGEYHLFFQHNPYGWGWGNMHWGHAVSRDLVHWTELSEALVPDDLGPMFSGSAVVDRNNTSGLGSPKEPAQVLVYTAAGDPTVQCVASSTDGRHYAKYEGNPVLKQISSGNRDPKVIWYEPAKEWVMTLWVEVNKVPTIRFLTSPNLKDWTTVDQTEGFFECPDFFELPIDDDSAKKKWVLSAGSSEYMVGSFNGTKFTPETAKLPGHRGTGFYAAQTFSDLPATDGRRIRVGWFQTETKGMPFNQSMTIPMELKLIGTTEGPRLTWTPVRELESLRAKSHKLGPITLSPDGPSPLRNLKVELVELKAEFDPGDASEVTFNVRGAAIVYDARKQELAVNNHRAPAPLRGGRQRLTVFCDRSGLEVFASDGLTYVPMPFLPGAEELGLAVSTRGSDVKFSKLEVHELKSAWPSE